jgi:AcrR family transcriptional regulator
MPSSPLAEKIITTTAKLIAEEGMSAATIRNIAKHASVLPPQIYKHVGSIDQLLDDVALHLWEARPRTHTESDVPINGLLHAIEDLIVFGMKHPDIYLHISKPRVGQIRTLWRRQVEDLSAAVGKVAKAGLLQVGEKQAVDFILPFCVGMIFTCLHETSRPQDPTWLAWQSVKPLLKKSAMKTMPAPEGLKSDANRKVPNLASELNANLGEVEVLTMRERWMLGEWLERIAAG